MSGQSTGASALLIGVVSVWLTGHPSLAAESQVGQAAWYAAGGITASGEPNVAGALTAAHRSLPFGTKVRVVNLANKKSVVVRINDRGAFGGRRVVDVSRAAAEQLGFIKAGIARVELTIVGDAADAPKSPRLERPSAETVIETGSPAPIEPPPVRGNVAARFEVAFERESWLELEMKKTLEAMVPALAP